MLHTCVASTDPDLTTTGALKARILGATATSTMEDAYFSALIRAASRWAESYIGYPLTLASYRETLPSYGTRTLRVARTPLRSISALYAATDTGEGSDATVNSSEFRVEDRDAGLISRDEGWVWTAPLEWELEARPQAGQEWRPWMVDYAAGYTYAGVSTDSPHYSTEKGTTSTGRTLPEDIEEAVILKAMTLSDGGGEVSGERLGDLQVNYRSGGVDRSGQPLPPPFEMILDPYRRVV